MRSSTLAAVVVLAALSSGVAVRPATAQSEVDDRGFRAHDRPDDRRDDGRPVDDGRDLIDDGFVDGGDDRVPDDVRRHDFQPNQDRHPTMLDGRRRHGRHAAPLPPSQQPPPMRPYWGTMQPYWKPVDPSGAKRSGDAHRH
jgi:hypothetical protein